MQENKKTANDTPMNSCGRLLLWIRITHPMEGANCILKRILSLLTVLIMALVCASAETALETESPQPSDRNEQ